MKRLPFALFSFLFVASALNAAEPSAVTAKKTDSAIEFYAGKELIARYHIGPDVAKPYLWPLNAPGGISVTRGWPMQEGLPNETKDHVHQKSAWFCHGDVIPEGLELKIRSADKNVKGVDFWSEGKGHGIIACVHVDDPKSDTNMAGVVTKNEWRAPDGTKILDEERGIAVQDLGDSRLIDIRITLDATVCPITFGDTKEGSMGIRVSDEFRLTAPKSDGIVTSSDGKTSKAPAKDNLPMWGKRADWNDYSGSVDGKMVGIAIFDHPPNNPRAAWHTRAYGLMAANPFGRASFPNTKGDLFKLAKGEKLKLHYGLLIHKGDASEAKIAERYAAFAKEK
jgi:hypothetical protein